MKVGDLVLTSHGERGIIVKSWDGVCYSFDWWVDIHFIFRNEQLTTRIMYKVTDLKKI